MRILWCGDAVASTGFSKCTHTVCDHLHSLGHEVHVLGLNHFGDPHIYPYPIYPCRQPFDHGHDGFGVTRLPILIDRLRPDVVILLNDPWNIPEYFRALHAYFGDDDIPCPILAWLAVDAKNQNGKCLNELSHIITWTQFAADELIQGGYDKDISIVPLGVDTSLFYPRDKQESRAKVLPTAIRPDSYIIGVVGRNQPRKRLDLTLQYFAEWIHDYNIPDAYLYLHVAPTGESGFDIRNLARYYNLQGRVILSEPHIGYGESESSLPYLYSSFDLYWTTSQGEGWGLPCLEAMACGVPCLVPDWSGLGSQGGWTQGAVCYVPCTSIAISAPLNSLAYTIGGIPDKSGCINRLDSLYRTPQAGRNLSEKGLRLAQSLTWKSSAKKFVAVLESVMRDTTLYPSAAEVATRV